MASVQAAAQSAKVVERASANASQYTSATPSAMAPAVSTASPKSVSADSRSATADRPIVSGRPGSRKSRTGYSPCTTCRALAR